MIEKTKYSPYSFSKIATHISCPRKFKFIYVDKIKIPFVTTEALRKGRAVHSILEDFPNPCYQKNANDYIHIVNDFLKTHIAQKLLFRESIREYKFGLNHELNACEYKDKNALFRGSIDYMCVIDKELYLCDWKTGKYKEQQYQDFRQLLFYAIYFFLTRPNIDTINIFYVYVEHGNTYNELKLERKYLDNYKKDFLTAISNIEKDVFFKQSFSKLCAYCDFNTQCDGALDFLKSINYQRVV